MSVMDWLINHPRVVISTMTALLVAGSTIAMSRKHINVARARQQKTSNTDMELLMMGMSAMTYRLHDRVLKIVRIDKDEAEITQANVDAMRNEASVYSILGRHCRIAGCLYVSLTENLILLKYYPHGNLRDYMASSPTTITSTDRTNWARQMIEGVAELHRNGVRHSDIRLDQWLVDDDRNARLSDFNASGFDANERLGLARTKALGLESMSHFMPRDPLEDSTVRSDLFALGSALYELEVGGTPFAGEDDETIEKRFEAGQFLDVEGLRFGVLIRGCWTGSFDTAVYLLRAGEENCGL